jgi:cardiolipin synthase A/B
MSRSLIVLPDDSPQPIPDAITSAKKTLRVKMFVFSDPVLLNAVAEARRRGLSVRIMLNPARRNGEDDNAEFRKQLIQSGVEAIHNDDPGGAGRLESRDRIHVRCCACAPAR